MRSRSLVQALPLVAPVHLLILSVIVLPSLFVIRLGASKSSFGQAPSFVGLENYIRVLSDPVFRAAKISVRGNRTPADVDVQELRRQQLERGAYLRNPDGSRASRTDLAPAA